MWTRSLTNFTTGATKKTLLTRRLASKLRFSRHLSRKRFGVCVGELVTISLQTLFCRSHLRVQRRCLVLLDAYWYNYRHILTRRGSDCTSIPVSPAQNTPSQQCQCHQACWRGSIGLPQKYCKPPNLSIISSHATATRCNTPSAESRDDRERIAPCHHTCLLGHRYGGFRDENRIP